MAMVINNKFSIGQLVYIKTDPDQHGRMVTAINVRPNDMIGYDLAQGTVNSFHYEFELSAEKNVLMTTTN